MKILLDTNVISELVRIRPDPKVAKFVAEQSDPVLSVISIHELVYSAERAPAAARRARLSAWIQEVRAQFSGRLIEVTAQIAERSGQIRASAAARGYTVEALDALIAASAISCAAHVATRNTADFEPLGVGTVNPWIM